MILKTSGIAAVLKEVKRKSAFLIERGKLAKANELISNLRDSTPIDTGAAKEGWKLTNIGVLKIENDVEYISELNNGSSQQAPTNFIESTLLKSNGVRPNGIIVTHK